MQTQKDPASINILLGETSFAPIIQKARLLLKIGQILRENLPEEYAAHAQVVNLKDDTLIIQVDSSAVATRLRYQERELIAMLKLRTKLQTISRIQVRTSPNISSLKTGNR